MLASLAHNTNNQQYIFLGRTHSTNENQIIDKIAQLEQSQLFDSDLVSQRINKTNCIIKAMNQALEADQAPKQTQFFQCQTCAIWKKWASQQEYAMLELDTKLIQKEIELKKFISNLQLIINQKNLMIQQLRQELFSQKANKQFLNLSLKEINDRYQKKIHQKLVFSTPLKTEDIARSPDLQYKDTLNIKMSQFVPSKNEAIKTSTIATKKNDWTECENNLQKTAKGHRNITCKNEKLDKYVFENQMLKQYNSALLQRLKMAKYKKAF